MAGARVPHFDTEARAGDVSRAVGHVASPPSWVVDSPRSGHDPHFCGPCFPPGRICREFIGTAPPPTRPASGDHRDGRPHGPTDSHV